MIREKCACGAELEALGGQRAAWDEWHQRHKECHEWALKARFAAARAKQQTERDSKQQEDF